MLFDGIGMNAIVDLGELTPVIPTKLLEFLIIKSLKLFNLINFKFGTNPYQKIKGNI